MASSDDHPRKSDAFTELMTPKSKMPKSEPSSIVLPAGAAAASSPPSTLPRIPGLPREVPESSRGGLAVYLNDPASFPPSTVVSCTPEFVTIRDLYPKASVHLLVLPRSPAKTHLHPFAAFDGSDPDFLAAVRVECTKAKQLAASELRRLFGGDSVQDQAREAVLSLSNLEEEGEANSELPLGRDWSASIMVGVHAVPSMSNLHIHVLSVDRHSEKLRHRNHYNSFSTPFFVPLHDFPITHDDVRRWPGREAYLRRDFDCWRCGTGFGNGFANLKRHLDIEFEEWRKE